MIAFVRDCMTSCLNRKSTVQKLKIVFISYVFRKNALCTLRLKHMSSKKDQRIEFITWVGIYEGMILFRHIDIFRCWLVLGRPRWRKWPSRKSDRNSRLVRIYLPYFPWKPFFFKIFKTLKISYSFRIKFSLM